MQAKIRHVALFTENYERMLKFYQTVFGMKQITSRLADEAGKQNAERGHISEGTIGFALLAKYPGSNQGLDHFGFEVDDVREVIDRLKRHYPETLVVSALDFVPFAGFRSHDPAGTQFDLSQKNLDNVREGYTQDGWEQPRWINHVSIRARKPDMVAEFYTKIFELKGVEEFSRDEGTSLTDGKVRLLIRPCNENLYRGMRQGLDHIGFQVENVASARQDLDNIATEFPQSAPKKLGRGKAGALIQRDLQACPIGKYAFCDPDGVLMDMTD
jgi:catechol 2,3-dioxygenase-like lactoylglutathione lyase family enzyme